MKPETRCSTADQANALRALAMDAVQQAGSGHPGAPMGMAEMAVALWTRHLKHNPANPQWADRDRFVLSNGHASMLLYGLLHLSGYDLSLDELKRFRQLGSKTPGHPEVGVTPGVETTTGPLGQGLGNAVGMALAEKLMADRFNRDDHRLVDHHTYVFLGDGCLMEGISHEAVSLAGTLKLGKLIALYDDNGISIDGAVTDWFADDSAARFKACGWQVIGPLDGHDVEAIDQAIETAKANPDCPSVIFCRTQIGRGSPNRQGTAKAHGEPLGADEIALTRAAIGWQAQAFEIPPGVRNAWLAREQGQAKEQDWEQRFAAYVAAFPELAAQFRRSQRGEFSGDQQAALDGLAMKMAADASPVATRKASQQVLAELGPLLPELLGGSADLTGSNLTDFPDCGAVRAGQPGGRHINYGVREFGMAAIMNGMVLHGGFIPYGGTFLTFSDYSRNAIRMAALMKIGVIHVFTHDSIGLGEDGPTHQPVEHAAALRLIPGLDVWRPCDRAETAAAWVESVKRRNGPSALLLTRQATGQQTRNGEQIGDISRGGYVLADSESPAVVLIATGSEVDLAVEARDILAEQGIAARVVSMPCTSRFQAQPADYQQSVLPDHIPRVGIEAGVSGWWSQLGCAGAIGVDQFGESAPGPQVYSHFGLTGSRLADLAAGIVNQTAAGRS